MAVLLMLTFSLLCDSTYTFADIQCAVLPGQGVCDLVPTPILTGFQTLFYCTSIAYINFCDLAFLPR